MPPIYGKPSVNPFQRRKGPPQRRSAEPEVHGFIYAPGPAGGEPRLLDEEGIGSAGRILALEVNSGEYCLQIEPPAGATGSVRVRVDLVGLTVPNPE